MKLVSLVHPVRYPSLLLLVLELELELELVPVLVLVLVSKPTFVY
ncbi:hypothetical protein [Thalassotalea litorea]|nr:hypothetical protein [Thalassotalea litorea]